VDQRLVARITQYFPAIEFEKIDCFGGVAVGFGPGLRHFMNHPRGEFMFALAKNRSDAKHQVGTFGGRGFLPRFEGCSCRFDCLVSKFFCGFLKAPD
jgi:hypothetical protein